jgi:hypothetical protein
MTDVDFLFCTCGHEYKEHNRKNCAATITKRLPKEKRYMNDLTLTMESCKCEKYVAQYCWNCHHKKEEHLESIWDEKDQPNYYSCKKCRYVYTNIRWCNIHANSILIKTMGWKEK